MRYLILSFLACSLPSPLLAQSKDGNRLAYLDEVNPYYPSRTFPKLITPQWVGEKGVEAVVILAIDDMRDPKRYEAFLRPILRRLQKIDGRAPVSIMTNKVDPNDPQLQTWLKEGLSIECHTLDHPCPFFAKGFTKAKETYDSCVDLMARIPNSKPVAFRMPCCDSMNTPSPRFYAEIFNKTTQGNFLTIDSSVFNFFTANDPDLPRELVLLPDGTERFRRYIPKDRSFVNTIENYPYPYVIGRLCWQFPCVTPSDWQAQHFHKPNNPETLRDWKAALDCTVIKQGVMCLVFHPHGWCKNDQIVELIDYAVAKHGKKVKFLNFREAQERLNRNLLDGRWLRSDWKYVDKDGTAHTKTLALNTLLDVNNDGYMDLVISAHGSKTRLWSEKSKNWNDFEFPNSLPVPQFAFFHGSYPSCVYTTTWTSKSKKWFSFSRFDFDETAWTRTSGWGNKSPVVRFVDIDGDGICEIVADDRILTPYRHRGSDGLGNRPFKLPTESSAVSLEEVRFLDLDGDGKLDIIFSNEKEYGIYLFKDMKSGWSRKVMAGKRGEPGASATGVGLPMISRNGTNNGFWVHSGHLWWSNEDTVQLKDHVDRRSIKELLKTVTNRKE